MKYFIAILTILLAFSAGLWISNTSFFPNLKATSAQEADLLLEKIEKVAKLVTVEGHISEVYDYKDYYGYDWSIFRKKALIRVKAKVSAGYDLGNITINTDSESRTINIEELPPPEILSIDHDLDYYDLTEGTFNSFSRDDFNKLNQQAKRYIEEIAKEGDIIREAEKRGEEMIEMIRFLVEGTGWTFMVTPTQTDKTKLPG